MFSNIPQRLDKLQNEIDAGILSPQEYIQALTMYIGGQDIVLDWYHIDPVARAEFASNPKALNEYEAIRPHLESAPVALVLRTLKHQEREGYPSLDTGDKIAAYRKLAGLSQDELASSTNSHKLTISKWERGLTTPSTQKLKAVADALDIGIEKII